VYAPARRCRARPDHKSPRPAPGRPVPGTEPTQGVRPDANVNRLIGVRSELIRPRSGRSRSGGSGRGNVAL